MDMRVASSFAPTAPQLDDGGGKRFLSLGLTALIAVAAGVQQAWIGLDTDVSWLISVCERVLGGDRLYRDIFELNPPASVLLYLPAVALASLVGVKAEALVAGQFFLLAAIAIASSSAILRRAGLITPARRDWLLPVVALVCLLVPGASFAQREHAALLLLLPWIALIAARCEHGRSDRSLALLAGIGAGLAIAIKPPFVLAAALPMLALLVRSRSPMPLFTTQGWACAAVVVAYAATIHLSYPDYAAVVLPLIRTGYLQVREPLAVLLGGPAVMMTLLAAGLALLFAQAKARRSLTVLPLLAALGFAAAMLVQGKGFANHHLPALGLSLIALGIAGPGLNRRAGATFVVLASAAALLMAQMATYQAAAALVRSAAPPRPTILVAGTNLAIGHPLTRWVDGRWAGTRGALWATGIAHDLLDRTADPQARAALEAQIADDRRIWFADLRRERPDVVLVDGREGSGWLRRHPQLRTAIAPYRNAGTADGITVLVRAP